MVGVVVVVGVSATELGGALHWLAVLMVFWLVVIPWLIWRAWLFFVRRTGRAWREKKGENV